MLRRWCAELVRLPGPRTDLARQAWPEVTPGRWARWFEMPASTELCCPRDLRGTGAARKERRGGGDLLVLVLVALVIGHLI